MADRFSGRLQLGGRVTLQQSKELDKLISTVADEESEDGGSYFHDCNSGDFLELIDYCRSNQLSLMLEWDARDENNGQTEYWLPPDREFMCRSDQQGRIYVLLEDLNKAQPGTTVESFVESLGVPDFPDWEQADE